MGSIEITIKKNRRLGKNFYQLFFIILIMGMIIGVTGRLAAEETTTMYYVPDDYPTIQQAINVAEPGDTVIVKTGVYQENVYIDKQLTLQGLGSPQITANGLYYCIELRGDNITIDNFMLTQSGMGGNKAAIRIVSNYNQISNCTITNNENYGILIYKDAIDNTISSSTVHNNKYGIHLQSTTNNIIKDCTVSLSDIYGIYLKYADENQLENTIISDGIVGLFLWDSDENHIIGNTISSSKLYGIDLRKSNQNMVYNNFLNNSKNGYDEGINSWYVPPIQQSNIISGPYLCGNYWSDYTDKDEDANGIGDVPHSIYGGSNQDAYPLYFQPNYAPYVPQNAYPYDEKISLTKTISASWNCSDPEGDACYYEVYLDTKNPPEQQIGATTQCAYGLGRLSYGQKYHWQVIAYDTTSWNHSTSGPIWTFTTQTKPNPPSSSGSTTQKWYPSAFETPVAIISTDGQNQGYINELITMDGTESYDLDGEIQSYTWDLGDGTTATGEITSHGYTTPGMYTITLTVEDNHGLTHTDSAIITIIKANRPPESPQITGTKTGTIGEEYTYQFLATDADNDNIQYIIDWGDGKTVESTFQTNASLYSATYQWSKADAYVLSAKTSDNETESATTSYTVLINSMYVLDKGYLMDEDNDGIYDSFKSNTTQVIGVTEKMGEETYLLDNNGDGEWEFEYHLGSQQLSVYNTDATTEQKESIMTMLVIGVISAIIVLVALGIIYKRIMKK